MAAHKETKGFGSQQNPESAVLEENVGHLFRKNIQVSHTRFCCKVFVLRGKLAIQSPRRLYLHGKFRDRVNH